MKKLTTAAIIAAGILASAVGASAANGDFVGYVYSTDILATVDGIPVTSYCLDGKTAVAVRDLQPLGFSVQFYDDARIATVKTPWDSLNASATEVTRGTVGEVVGTIVESDIVLYVNGTEVPCYNIGGRLVAAIEDLAPVDHNSSLTNLGYSETELAHAWDEETRTIALYTLAGFDNSEEAAQIAAEYNLRVEIVTDDGEVALVNNPLSQYTSCFTRGSYERYAKLYHIAADGTRTELGYMYTGGIMTYDYDANTIRIGSNLPAYCFDLDALRTICEQNPGTPATVEEETQYWQDGGELWWDVTAVLETDDYIVLTMRIGGLPHGAKSAQTLRLDREPRQTETISREWMNGAEIYDDMLYYFSGTGLYKQSVYETTAELVCEATDENIDAYLREHWQVLYEAEDADAHVYLLQGSGVYRIYRIDADGIGVTYIDEIAEAFAYGIQIVFDNADGRQYANGVSVYSEEYYPDETAEVLEKGTKIV